MLTYILVAGVLATLAVGWAIFPRRGPLLGGIGAIVLALFAGLRFETGFDWQTYEVIFGALNGHITDCDVLPRAPSVEPFYAGINYAVNSAGGNLSWIFLGGALFNMAVLWWVASRISNASPVMWLVYFGVTFLAAQMAMERQSIASSFVLLGLVVATTRYWPASAVPVLAGMGFHASVGTFLPLVVLSRFRPAWWLSAAIVGAGAIVAALGIDLFRAAASIVEMSGQGWLADKISLYARTEAAPISLGAIGLIGLHVLALVTFHRFSNAEELRDPVITVAIWLTLGMLAAHLYLSALPVVWNRVMLVAIPWQVVSLFRLRAIQGVPTGWRLGLVAGLAVFSVGSLAYFLIKPEAAPFLPYNSTVAVALTGNVGDGEARADAALAAYVEANPEIQNLPAPVETTAPDLAPSTAYRCSFGPDGKIVVEAVR